MMFIAYDLGTGGIKASLFDETLRPLADSFVAYDTFYPHEGWHDQRPADWWNGVCASTKYLLAQTGANASDIACVALSGHSLVVAPLGADGELLSEYVPIWSDTRARDVVDDFFSELPYDDWYMTTGNGDPPPTYSILKLMWLRRHHPEVFEKARKVLGSKDYINYRLTGNMLTDPSYASGFGVFNLLKWNYEPRFFEHAGISSAIFPDIAPSEAVIGKVTKEAEAQTGLMEGTPVVCGGVDNMCMALGACGIGEGRTYTSLGSSSWIAVTSKTPVLDPATRPFIFAHAVKGWYTSGVSIFSAGNSLRWARDTLCRDFYTQADAFARIDELVAKVPVGANGVLFNPTLAGASPQEAGERIKGSYMGLSLHNTRGDLLRATMEGIAMALAGVLGILKRHVALSSEMLICGGGSKSAIWREIFANVFNQSIIKTNIDQNAASLGATALAANACGLWSGYANIEKVHQIEDRMTPEPPVAEKYSSLIKLYDKWALALAELSTPE